nr:MAG TPA: hypothetical protein [Caudoviricetes sp.]
MAISVSPRVFHRFTKKSLTFFIKCTQNACIVCVTLL